MSLRRFILIFLLSFCALSGFGQSHYVDSLENLLKKPIPDTVKVWALNELSREQVFGSPEESFHFAKEALDLATKIDYKRGQAYSYRVLASISGTNDRYLTYSDYLQKAIKLFMELQDSVGLANCYITEAVVYDRQLNFENAINSYLKALPIFRNAKMRERVAVCLNNMGFVYYQMGSFEKARVSLEEASEISQLINRAVLLDIQNNLGLVFLKLGSLDKANEYFDKVMALHKELKGSSNPEAYVETLIGKSQIHKLRKQFNEEKKLLDQAKLYAERFNNIELKKQIYLRLSEYYLHTNNYNRANEMLTQFGIIDDSVTQQHRRSEAATISSLINSVKLETDFELAQNDLEKQEQVIEQQGRTLIVVALVGVVFLVLIILLFLVNRSRREVNKALAAHRIALDAKNSELEKLNQTKDKFFSVVAHDLRSPLNSLLGFSSLLAKHASAMTKEEIETMGGQLKESVGNTLKMTENLIAWARSQMREEQTNPEMITLKTSVAETIKVFSEQAAKKGVSIEQEEMGETQVFVDRNHLSLILRNLVNNAIKYTQAGDKISARAVQNNGHTRIEIEDTGLGMDDIVKENLFSLEGSISTEGTFGERGTGLGLIMCKDYVERNGGSLLVQSEKNKGTSFVILLPSSNHN